MDYDKNITACMIPGDTPDEIEQHLETLTYGVLKELLKVYKCPIKDLAKRIAQGKGIKCSKESKNDKKSGRMSRKAKSLFY